jgi:lambda repressor-like predicted transcriptional regulator
MKKNVKRWRLEHGIKLSEDERARERWVPIKGFEQYEISDLGRVRRIIVGQLGAKGHHMVALWNGHGKRKIVMVHGLVAEHFIGPRPTRMLVHHQDDDPGNNRALNLEYTTKSQNAVYAVRSGRTIPPNRPRKLGPEQEAQVRGLYQQGIQTGVLAKQFGLSTTTLRQIYLRDITPHRRRKLSVAIEKDILKRYRVHGVTAEQLASEYGLSASYLRTRLLAPLAKAQRGDREKHAIALYKQGESISQIHKSLGMAWSTIANAIERVGLKVVKFAPGVRSK